MAARRFPQSSPGREREGPGAKEETASGEARNAGGGKPRGMEVNSRFDRWDPERLLQCPFNKHHQIRASRFPYHLVKCRKSYPEVAKQLATCPFNARHLVPYAALSEHILKCDDQEFAERHVVFEASGSHSEQMSAASTWEAPPCEENWETESLEESESPFVWSPPSFDVNSSSATSVPKNVIPAGIRAPKPSSFPGEAEKYSQEH